MTTPSLKIDHLAVACSDLRRGTDWLEALLGVETSPGGAHERFGTHNRLVGLGPEVYLEVIAPDPDVPPPDRPRWFELDTPPAAPCLTNWIVQTHDFALLDGVGPPMSLSRGRLTWEVTVPDDGSLPRQGGLPTLIRWPGGVHPAATLPDHGLRLGAFEVHHPDAGELGARVLPLLSGPVTYHPAEVPMLRARIDGRGRQVWLE